LLLCRLGQVRAIEPRVSLEPLQGLDKFERIGGRYQDLAYQWIRIERDWRYQVVKLIGRQCLSGRGQFWGLLGKQ
jgi:hypothetical protein